CSRSNDTDHLSEHVRPLVWVDVLQHSDVDRKVKMIIWERQIRGGRLEEVRLGLILSQARLRDLTIDAVCLFKGVNSRNIGPGSYEFNQEGTGPASHVQHTHPGLKTKMLSEQSDVLVKSQTLVGTHHVLAIGRVLPSDKLSRSVTVIQSRHESPGSTM